MEIVKLGNIFDFSTGTSSLPKDYKNGNDILFINYKDVFAAKPIMSKTLSKIKILKNKDYSNKMVYKNDLVITSSSETSKDNGMVSIYSDNTPALLNGFSKKMVINKHFEDKIINKYIFYLLNTLEYRKRISNCSNGITRHNIIWNYFYKIEVMIIPLKDQQAIIDIIEPFEKMKNFISNKLHKIEKIIEIIINNESKIIDTFFNEKIKFNKGINFKSEMVTENKSALLFINVSSINNNPNKFIHEEYKNLVNVIEGDVILSLDGNTGLVNNFLKGINGYGYKITSNKYENYQLYYSLLARINQNIIKQNSHGTTIMHATRAKEKILILDFFNNNILSIFYKLELNYKSQLKLINSNIELLIEKYII